MSVYLENFILISEAEMLLRLTSYGSILYNKIGYRVSRNPI